MKRIGILTQPLHNNYGGLLQAFALQKTLYNLGHEPITIDFTSENKSTFRGIVRNIIKKYVFRRKINSVFGPTEEEKSSIGRETQRFVAQNIKTTQRFRTIKELSYLTSYNFDAYVVGSDQVWRPVYSPGLSAFFLSFLNKNEKVTRISYAASFGTDSCSEYTEEQIKKYSDLLGLFDGVSVREDSAVELCNKEFSTSAIQVLDPTLLLNKEEYIDLVSKDKVPENLGDLMVYILDKTPEKQSIIDLVAKEKELTPFSVMPSDVSGVYPPVTSWLQGFKDSEFIVTDSFHGVAFSILFNKPFIAIGNKYRGVARFTSILKMFGLEGRLISSINDLDKKIVNEVIDYDKVNTILEDKREMAIFFLNKHLS